jgi:hypothetical protein
MNTCESGIQSWNETNDLNAIMIGQTFLKNYYTVFDYDNARISFAANSENDWAKDIAFGFSTEAYLAIVGACLFGLFCLCGLACYCKHRKVSQANIEAKNEI